jgi:SNF2 family DNA or RNA helicase
MLAFDPGLGKTVSSIAAVERLRDKGVISGPGVVVAPASLKYQWAREIHRYTDRRAVVVDGTPAKRAKQYVSVCDYLILSYDMFVRDWAHHKNVRAFLIADEASALRGWDTKRTKHFKKVRDHYPVRFALTATPIENGRAEEIFSIFDWLEPGVLGRYWEFERKYLRRNSMGWIDGYRNLDDFHRRIKPYVIRKSASDEDVAGVLPAVVHKEPVVVRLGGTVARIHDRMVEDLLLDLDEMAENLRLQAKNGTLLQKSRSKDHVDGRLMAKVQALRMLLDHPDLLREHAATNDAAGRVLDLYSSYFDLGNPQSAKLDALETYVQEFLDVHPANKVVVFCSFVGMARRIADRLMPHLPVVFNGSMLPKQRDEAKQEFATNPQCRVFVSTDAGGYGLDLPEANMVINYDLPWSAGMLTQRNGRIRRASSEWGHVTVQDMVVEGSIEERMLRMLEHKEAVADAVLSGEGITESGGVSSDLDTLRSFLQGSGVIDA